MECKRTREFCKLLSNCNALILPIVGSIYTPPGWPDRYIAHPLWNGFIEFKEATTRLQPHQERILRELNKRNPHSAYLCRFLDLIEGEQWIFSIEYYNGGRNVNVYDRFACSRAYDLLVFLNKIRGALC